MDVDPALLAHIAIPPKLLASIIVLVLVLVIWGIVALAKSGNKKQSHMTPNAPPCPTCFGPARWNYNGWVCDRCQRALPPPPLPMGMPHQHGQMMPPNMAQPGMPPHMQQPNMQPMQQPGMPPLGAPQPQMAPMQAAPSVTCQTCGSPGRWIPESNGWGCDRCRQMIAPSGPA